MEPSQRSLLRGVVLVSIEGQKRSLAKVKSSVFTSTDWLICISHFVPLYVCAILPLYACLMSFFLFLRVHQSLKWTNPGLTFLYFRIFQLLTVNMFFIKFCGRLDSNRRPLESEATALPTMPQPLSTCPLVCLCVLSLSIYLSQAFCAQ